MVLEMIALTSQGTKHVGRTLLAFVCLISLAHAEASIAGTVKDPDGALVATQEVVITNVTTHEKVKVNTDRRGDFGPVSLLSGRYKLDIRAKCFRNYSKMVEIVDGQLMKVDVQLKLSCPKDLGPIY